MDHSKLNPENAESVTEFSKNVILFTDFSIARHYRRTSKSRSRTKAG